MTRKTVKVRSHKPDGNSLKEYSEFLNRCMRISYLPNSFPITFSPTGRISATDHLVKFQSIDRVNRRKQKNDVVIIDFMDFSEMEKRVQKKIFNNDK